MRFISARALEVIVALRWRDNGAGLLLCAAMHSKMEDDIYIDDEEQYELAVMARVIQPDEKESQNGIWHIINARVFTYILFGDDTA